MFPSEHFSTKELGPRKVLSTEVGGSGFPSVLVAKSSCRGSAGAGVAGRTVEAAGAAVAAATAAGGWSVSIAARESEVLPRKGQAIEGPERMRPL